MATELRERPLLLLRQVLNGQWKAIATLFSLLEEVERSTFSHQHSEF